MNEKFVAAAEPLIDELANAEPEVLFEQLGVRAAALERDYGLAGAVVSDSFTLEYLSLDLDYRAIGRKVFETWNPIAWNLICGQGAADKKDRQQFLAAFDTQVDSKTVALALTSALIALGVAAPYAPLIALLVLKFALQPSYNATCAAWKKHLPEPK